MLCWIVFPLLHISGVSLVFFVSCCTELINEASKIRRYISSLVDHALWAFSSWRSHASWTSSRTARCCRGRGNPHALQSTLIFRTLPDVRLRLASLGCSTPHSTQFFAAPAYLSQRSSRSEAHFFEPIFRNLSSRSSQSGSKYLGGAFQQPPWPMHIFAPGRMLLIKNGRGFSRPDTK